MTTVTLYRHSIEIEEAKRKEVVKNTISTRTYSYLLVYNIKPIIVFNYSKIKNNNPIYNTNTKKII